MRIAQSGRRRGSTGEVRASGERFPEEERSRQPSVFSVLRALVELFASPEDEHLGLYGAFGYDLAFQFEPITLRLARPDDQRDLVLYLPDELLIVDHMRQQSPEPPLRIRGRRPFDRRAARATRAGPVSRRAVPAIAAGSDHGPGEYAALVRRAKEAFKRGDLFEVVRGQLLSTRCPDPPSLVFRRLREPTRRPTAP